MNELVERGLSLLNVAPEPVPIFVTKPTLPPLQDYTALLQRIWQTRWLTNQGEFHTALEMELSTYLKTPHLSLTANGTLALLLALKSVGIHGGSVVTTPFTFPATTHCLDWLGATSIFADVDPNTCNIDPHSVRERIRPDTTAILAVHVYGTPCDHAALRSIANERGLKLVYDAAHAFGVEVDGCSVLAWGDASAVSFHATKLFSTIEGGAVISETAENKHRVDRLRNFGIANEETVLELGINAKLNEIQAAYGLLTLKTVANEIAQRRRIATVYDEALAGVDGVTVLTRSGNFKRNYAYYAIRIDPTLTGISREIVYSVMKHLNIFTRKYFHPIPPTFSQYANLPTASREALPMAFVLGEQSLCLPIYGSLPLETAQRIAQKLAAVIRLGDRLTFASS